MNNVSFWTDLWKINLYIYYYQVGICKVKKINAITMDA